MKIRKSLHQLAENNRKIKARQVDIKIEVVRLFGFLLHYVQSYIQHRVSHENVLRESLTSSGKPIYRATLTSPCRPARASLRAEISSKGQPHPSSNSGKLTFSSLPISSLTSDLLGVVVSTLPSASLPGHNNIRCFPLRNVLPTTRTDHQYRVYIMSPEHNIPFLAEQPKRRAAHGCRCARPCYIPYSKRDLGAEREIAVADRQRNPLIPPV